MTEVNIHGRTFRFTPEQLEKLNALLKTSEVKARYGKDWEPCNITIQSVVTSRWSDGQDC